MAKGKKYIDSAKLIDRAAQYDVTEAMELVVKTASAKCQYVKSCVAAATMGPGVKVNAAKFV